MTTSKRSAIHFVVFIVVAVSMTIFLLGKAEDTMEEIERLNTNLLIHKTSS